MLPFPPIERVVETIVPDVQFSLLLDFLVARFDYLDRDQWLEQLALGNLEVNGRVAGAETPLRRGDRVFFQALGLKEQEVCWDVRVLQEEAEYLLVDKPGNLPCHPAGRFFNNTLWAWLRQVRHLDNIHFVSRLDRETSGVMLIGKNAAFAARASRAMHAQGGNAVKEYVVAVHGRFPYEHYFANGFLMQDPESPVRKKKRFVPMVSDGVSDQVDFPADPEAVTAVTDLRRLGFCRLPTADEPPQQLVRCPDGDCTLLLARLTTGRTHQIRATMHSLGYPVVGDKLYGLDDTIFLRLSTNAMTAEDYRVLGLPGQALHATRLEIPSLGIAASTPPRFL